MGNRFVDGFRKPRCVGTRDRRRDARRQAKRVRIGPMERPKTKERQRGDVKTSKFEPYGFDAICGQRDVGGTQPLTMNDGVVVEPLFLYGETDAAPNREYVEFVGDVFHEIVCEGIYDERLGVYAPGTQWAELNVVRFSMLTKHPALGDLVISLDNSRSGSRASLRAVTPNAKFPVLHRARLFITATASAMPGVILQNRGAPLFVHSDHLDQWPPADSLYRLNVKVPLERRDRPGEIVITLNPGAMRVGQVA